MRKHEKNAVNEMEILLKDIFDSIQDGISVLDSDLNILFVNPAIKRWYAHRIPLIGKKCYEVYHGRTDPCEICPSMTTLAKGKQSSAVVYLTGENIKGWFEIFTFPLAESKTGKVTGVIEYIRDVTERKYAEKVILQAKKEWENAFDTVRDLIFITDKKGVIKRVNRSLADKLKVLPHDLIGKTCWTIFKCGHKDTENCSLIKIQQGLSLREHEVEIPSLGIWVIAHVYAGYSPSKELEYIVHTYRDITEHKRLEEQLLQFNKIEAVARLAGGIAHEFNNLLTGIIGNLGLAQLQLDPDSEEHLFIIRANTAAEKASLLVRRLLAFAGQLQVTYNLISVNDIVPKVVSLIKETIDPRIKIVVKAHKDIWPVMADPSQISNMLLSLLVNARDAVMECINGLFKQECRERESFTIKVELENAKIDEQYCKVHTDAQPGEYLRITVTDNGPGMDPKTQNHIFEPFFTTREPCKAKGLGLATVYGIVKQYKGWITVESELGAGTTFKVYLPRSEAL
jgi:PAS domain S-box-containing protein